MAIATIEHDGDISITGNYLRNGASIVPGVTTADIASLLAEGRMSQTIAAYILNNRTYNVRDYGAKGDSATDDTAAFQACFDAAAAMFGTIIIPPADPNCSYRLTSTVWFRPAAGGAQVRFRVQGAGNYRNVLYDGAAGGSVFCLKGVKDTTFDQVHVSINNKHNVTVWDLRCTVDAQSSSHVVWRNCVVDFGNGGACRGFRSMPGPGGIGDFAGIIFDACVATGQGRDNGDIGWHTGTTNSTPWVWQNNSGASNCRSILVDGPLMTRLEAGLTSGGTTVTVEHTRGFANSGYVMFNTGEIAHYTSKTATTFVLDQRGALGTTASAPGIYTGVYEYVVAAGQLMAPCGDKFFNSGCGGSANWVDYELTGGGNFSFRDIRSEEPFRLMHCGVVTGGFLQMVTLDSVVLGGIAGDPTLIRCRTLTSLRILNPQFNDNAQMFGQDMIYSDAGSPGWLSLVIEGGQIRGTDPCYHIPGVTNAANAYVAMRGVARLNAGYATVGHFADPAA